MQTGVVKISFNDQGLISSVTRPWGFMDAGELGDIAIDANGTMYIITTEQAGFQFYRLDLNNPAAQLQLIGNYASTLTGAPQLFIDDQGRLIANHTVTGDWYSLNPNAGGVLEMITGPGFGLEYNDLAEGGVVGTVPEPGSLLLMGIAGALGCLRRKRCA